MAQGLQVFNADESLRDDVTTRFSRIVKRVYIPTKEWKYWYEGRHGIVSTPILSGSFTVPEFADWTPFYFFTGGEFAPKFPPDVTISGTTLSWEIRPQADSATFFEANLNGYLPGVYTKSYVGGFWLNVGVY